MQQARTWVEATFLGAVSDFPASFSYAGRSSRTFLDRWNRKHTRDESDPQRVRHVFSYTDPETRLRVRYDVIQYNDFPAIEWNATFENMGTAESSILSDLFSGDFIHRGQDRSAFVLYHADGSQTKVTDFRPHRTPLEPGRSLAFAPQGGRSSDGVMPYFTVDQPTKGGIVVAVGWTGQWNASYSCEAGSRVRIRIGLEHVRLKLRAGERIRTPGVLLLFYDGNRTHGQNLWRKMMRTHYTPQTDGQPVRPPLAASGAIIGFNKVAETNQRLAIENILQKKLPIDTWWMDAGWSLGGFPEGMGNWKPDPVRFPKGLEPVSDFVHRAGLRFLLWFEPERVMPNTALRRDHPEWLLAPADLPKSLAYQHDWRLLDLGNPAALEWAKKYFSDAIRRANVDIYRHDCNLHPLYYWRANEADDRKGIHEIRYIEGLYDYFDSLRKDHPALLIDNCASGGRRLDFEMMKRSLPLWRSDYCWDPVGAQCITYGLSFWLPLHGLGAVSVAPYDFRSGMGTNVSLPFDYYSNDASFWNELKRRIEEYQAVRDCFAGDYYPLTDYSTKDDTWMAWQFDRPELGKGILQAFRREKCVRKQTRFKLQGLERDARYEVRDLDRQRPTRMTGGALLEEGMRIEIPEHPGAAVVLYERLTPPASRPASESSHSPN